MFTKRFLLVLLFAVFYSFHSNLYSQSSQNHITTKIGFTIFASGDNYSDLEKSLINSFKESLEAKGLFSETDFDIELLIAIKEINGTNKVAIQVSETEVLPKEAIEIGKKAEIFYSSLDEKKKAKLPEEGKIVREYVSEEYLKQFRSIWSNDLEIIEKSEIDNFIQKIISKFK